MPNVRGNVQCHWSYPSPLCFRHLSRRRQSMFVPRGNARSRSKGRISYKDSNRSQANFRTVKPLLRVVLSVFAPWLTGVANPLSSGLWFRDLTALRAVRLRAACRRLSASDREAMQEKREYRKLKNGRGNGRPREERPSQHCRNKIRSRSSYKLRISDALIVRLI